eukprot:gene8427-biopygen18122
MGPQPGWAWQWPHTAAAAHGRGRTRARPHASAATRGRGRTRSHGPGPPGRQKVGNGTLMASPESRDFENLADFGASRTSPPRPA